MSKKFKRYDKRTLPMLYVGLFVWIVTNIVASLLADAGQAQGQEGLMEMLKAGMKDMPVLVLMLTCLLQPVLEECSFRLWGIGKKWATIVCLVLMAIFGFSELGLWALLFIAAFIVVWLKVKDSFKQHWLNALITSACFALCHISGFATLDWGMVLGLLSIFGMALVMCWLTLNLSFWFSCLLHVCNNSIAILWPLIFTATPVTNTYTIDDGAECNTELRAFKTFNDRDLVDSIDNLGNYFVENEMVFVGEPSEIAVQLLNNVKDDDEYGLSDFYYDWLSKNEDIEERVVYTLRHTDGYCPSPQQVLANFLKDYEAYNEDAFVFDTTDATLMDVYLIYNSDSSRVNINSDSLRKDLDYFFACHVIEHDFYGRTTLQAVTYLDSDSLYRTYALPTTRPSTMIDKRLPTFEDYSDLFYGFRVELVPTDKKVKLVTVK